MPCRDLLLFSFSMNDERKNKVSNDPSCLIQELDIVLSLCKYSNICTEVRFHWVLDLLRPDATLDLRVSDWFSTTVQAPDWSEKAEGQTGAC